MEKCKCANLPTVNFRGEYYTVDPCIYETEEVLTNCIVVISKCKNCGTLNFEWQRTEDTESLPPKDWENIIN